MPRNVPVTKVFIPFLVQDENSLSVLNQLSIANIEMNATSVVRRNLEQYIADLYDGFYFTDDGPVELVIKGHDILYKGHTNTEEAKQCPQLAYIGVRLVQPPEILEDKDAYEKFVNFCVKVVAKQILEYPLRRLVYSAEGYDESPVLKLTIRRTTVVFAGLPEYIDSASYDVTYDINRNRYYDDITQLFAEEPVAYPSDPMKDMESVFKIPNVIEEDAVAEDEQIPEENKDWVILEEQRETPESEALHTTRVHFQNNVSIVEAT